jgi:uncharacterized membrane protein YeaQ/YmgE (transglycosylase-associated protein family)
MGIFLGVVFGLAAGSVARMIMPGPPAGGMAVASALGISGALLGGLAGLLLPGTTSGIDFRSFLTAMIGSLAVLICYRAYAMRAMA